MLQMNRPTGLVLEVGDARRSFDRFPSASEMPHPEALREVRRVTRAELLLVITLLYSSGAVVWRMLVL